MEVVIIGVLTAVFILLIKRIFFKSRIEQLVNKLPGPKAYPIFGNTLAFIGPPEKRLKEIRKSDIAYPGIYRTWIGSVPVVNIISAEYAEPILNSNVILNKGVFYKFVHAWLGTGLLTSEGQKWFKHRKMITPTFHFKILDSFMDIYNENCLILIDKLNKRCSTGEEFDIYPYITHCALDIICETAMGTTVNAQKAEDSPYVKSLYRVAKLTVQRITRPWLHSDFVYPYTPSGREYFKHLKVLHDFTGNVITDRKESRKERNVEEEEDDAGVKKRKAFLDLLLDESEKDVANRLTDVEIREEVDTFMFEGHDTTTSGMTWTLFLLGAYPEIQEEVYHEVERIFHDEPDRMPTMRDLGEMKRLEQVIKESLRLYPPVPFFSRNLHEDLQLGEYLIPRGVNLGFNVYGLHRDPKVFKNPEDFNPDNFLPENTDKRSPYAYAPFSAGSRNCIGQKFAMLEEKTILSHIIRNFKIKSVEKRDNLAVVTEIVLRPKNGVLVRLTKR